MKQTPRSAFSLIEMFIVMTIITLLIALLLPTMRRIRSAANTAVCASQLKQIYQAATIRRDKVGVGTGALQVSSQRDLGPDGWPGQVTPFLSNQGRILICPEDEAPSSNDSLNNYALATNCASSSDPNGQMVVSLAPGTWCVEKDSDASGNPYPSGKYELWFEDQGGSGGGDKDYNDVQLLIDTTTPGQVTITVIRNGSASYTNNVVNLSTMSVLLANVSHTQGATAIIPVAGITSYAVNKNLNDIWGNAGKIWAMDYQNALVCDPSTASWTYPPSFARHSVKTKMNVMYGDGSVRTVYPRDVDPALATNGINLWQK